MNTTQTPLLRRFRQTLSDHLTTWLIPTVVIGTLGSVYALVRPATWESTQAILVRDEVVGELSQSGRFDTADARKAAQETIIQVVRNRNVVEHALEQVGPPSKRRTANWPTESDIRSLQERITVMAPKGAEFGQSDVIYVKVKARTEQHAAALNRAVCDQLVKRLQTLRNHRAESVIRELKERLKLTQANLDENTLKLETMEKQVGSDLGELRTLNQSGTGESNLRTSLNQIKNEMLTNRSARTTLDQQLQFLLVANDNPETLVATPNGILDSQPALRRLKEGLIDAQLRIAQLLGDRNPAHPAVKAAMAAESEVRQHLHAEISTAIRGVRAELKVTDAVIASLNQQLSEVQARLDQLASMRARYSNLVAEVQDRGEQVKEAQRSLAEANAGREASGMASLITRVDAPDQGDGPVGPGRLTLLLAAWLGGFAIGVGMLLLTVAPSTLHGVQSEIGRRWSDRVGIQFGRRSSDPTDAQRGVRQNTGRRESDRDKRDDESSPSDRDVSVVDRRNG